MRPSDLGDACRAAIQKHRMLTRGDRLVVGVSGGADSVALLHFLRGAAGELGITLTAAHLNHRLRGAESDRDEEHVRVLCDRWGLPVIVQSAEVAVLARERGLSVEECAREERYRFFRQAAGEGKIATAHTLDDSAETVLLNLARGTGLRGLCGIPPVREGIVRPLIGCTREQVEAYCRVHALPYVTDSTNQTDAYTRNRLRRHAMPVLREINPSLPRTMAGTMDALRADADLLDRMAEEALTAARLDRHRCRADRLGDLPEPLRLRALLRLLREHDVPAAQRRLRRMDALLGEGGQIQLSGRWYCRCEDGVLSFLPAIPTIPSGEGVFPSITLTNPFPEQVIRAFSGKTLYIAEFDPQNYKETMNYRANQFQNALDCDRIGWIVQLRQRLPGDRIRLFGRGCTKTLKKLYNEAGLTPRQRRETLVLAGSDGLLWVEGFGASEHGAVRADTRRMISIEVRAEGAPESGGVPPKGRPPAGGESGPDGATPHLV